MCTFYVITLWSEKFADWTFSNFLTQIALLHIDLKLEAKVLRKMNICYLSWQCSNKFLTFLNFSFIK